MNAVPAIRVSGLRKRFRTTQALDGVSLDVQPGEFFGLLGPNGAGKTTTFRMTIGMIAPDEGSVIFDGVDVTSMPMYKRARRGMGYLSQEPSIFQRLTVRQNLLAILETMNLSRRVRHERCEHLLEQFGLTHVREQLARTLSGGERRKLEIARALVTNPTMILLDEPFSGVDPIAVEDLQREIRGLRDRGISILLTDHNVRETLTVTDRSYIIDNGKVLREGPPRELINDDLVRKTYLGHTFRGDEFDQPYLQGR
ncbi:MAG TPA: LPS export ABC transporter ATP-binding protein [Phycisphaerales bacterium]|nr:LPS export ABC transporter ATP-binding protein [Phycisphaerales bacterium]